MTKYASRTLGALALGSLLAAMPVAGFHAGGLSAPLAFAKDGSDDKGGDDNGGGGKGGDDKGGGGKSGSGSSGSSGGGGKSGGSGKSGSGSSGSTGGGGKSSDDSGGDDHGGRGSDDSGDDHGGQGGSDDSGGDDHGGRSGSDDSGGDDHGGRSGGSDDASTSSSTTLQRSGGLRVTRIERTAAGVEVTYSNGVREEVENGRLEQKDASGRTVLERPATRRDLARLEANARNSGLTLPAAATGAPSVEAAGGNIEVSYPTGWREELEEGRYELKDPDGNTVVERPATAADIGRLRALVGG